MTDYHESSCAQTPCCGDYTPKFPNSASNNYKVPLGLRGIDDYLLDGPQLFKVHTRAYVEYAEGSFYPEKGGKTSFRRGGTEDCESPSEYFPYMYDLDACYLDQTKHYDLIGATLNKPGSPADSDAFNVDLGNPLHNVYVKQTHFYAVTQDDDEARVEIRLSEACAEKFSENGFHTSEELTTCEFTVGSTGSLALLGKPRAQRIPDPASLGAITQRPQTKPKPTKPLA